MQRIVPHYREPFFRGLHASLAEKDISLHVYYGQEQPGSTPRGVVLNEPWATRLNNRYFSCRNIELVWQPCLSALQQNDLVIVEQANRLLINHVLQLKSLWRPRRLAFWGHGRNLQAGGRENLRERFKGWRACNVDWWFAYTEATQDLLIAGGYPESRISTVNNTIDVEYLGDAVDAVDAEGIALLKAELGIGDGSVGLYCGGLYGDKRIDFLIDACRKVKVALPDFHMIVIGEGPESDKVAAAAAGEWFHYVGPVYGENRAPYLKLTDVLLMPGAVGLVVMDSFVSESPLITTDINTHGPEAAYIRPGVNGVVSANSIDEYVCAVTASLEGDVLFDLRRGCRDSAGMYTLDKMISNFSAGIVDCLER